MNELSEAVAAARDRVWAAAPSLADLEAACEHYHRPELRVAVLGPFNQGKSTLLNAVLGGPVLPVDIVRATAGPIVVRDGPAPETRLLLADGTSLAEPGFELLRRCTLANGEDPLRGKVHEVEVVLPHPLLGRNVALVDLPGTGDSPERDEVVRRELLSVDLVVQVLNGAQLLTLEERRSLEEWVLGRGIGVVFAVNFLNLLEDEDRERVWQRAAELAEGLKVALPPGPRVLRVDALPAMQARMRGDAGELDRSGLTAFLECLCAALDDVERRREAYRLPRVMRLARQVVDELGAVRGELDRAVHTHRARRAAEQSAAEARATRLGASLSAAAEHARSALALAALQRTFGAAVSSALRGDTFASWRRDTLVPWLAAQAASINAVAEEVSPGQGSLAFAIPRQPSVSLPSPPSTDTGSVGGSVAAGAAMGFVAGSIIPVFGHLFGVVAGGLAGLGRAEERKEEAARAWRAYEEDVATAYRDASARWLAGLSTSTLSALDARVAELVSRLAVKPPVASREERALTRRMTELDAVLARLHAADITRLADAA
jgi:hypothetical protein